MASTIRFEFHWFSCAFTLLVWALPLQQLTALGLPPDRRASGCQSAANDYDFVRFLTSLFGP